jgi:hypothetical protein
MAAALVTNPIDVLKIRLQIQGNTSPKRYTGFIQGGLRIFQEEGLRGLYRGITASLMREASYSSLRLAGYDLVKELLASSNETPSNTPLWKKAVSGLTSGASAAAIANPADLVKVRMQAFSGAGASRYSSTWAALADIYTKNGWKGLYRGVGPSTQRAALLTASQLASYDHIKQWLLSLGYREGIPLHGVCSFLAGFVCAAVTSPVDLLKTRVMNAPPGKYSSAFDCMRQTYANEGPLGFYKGFFPNWYRIAPHTVVTMLVYEQFRRVTGMRPV